ncbi:Circularly permutated [Collichthys lucidus]|uniref:Circularly permutated n=1 Tax=Collichthys lucidus TaxID=240159 RepID=A0A4U5VW39_COLLU|nr:Circularly permutated [Collichthys lucidus]
MLYVTGDRLQRGKSTRTLITVKCDNDAEKNESLQILYLDLHVRQGLNHQHSLRSSGPVPPPVPPRHRPRPTSLPPHPLPRFQPPPRPSSLPPPVPPRADKLEAENRLKVNVNVVSLSVGNLVWVCEFCGCANNVDNSVTRVCIGQRAGVHSDDLYLPDQSEDDYQNLEDTLVVFCVDISGSMIVTTEGMQDALKRALLSLLQQSPHRRVALVTFGDEVVIYGDGTSTPLTLHDWALVDYDHIWQQGVAYTIPHCIAETYPQLIKRVKELREYGATSLGPAALASVAMASRYPGSKVVLCTDGMANIGLGAMEQTPSLSSSSPLTPTFYTHLAEKAVESGVIISVMTFEGTDCRLADVGRLADSTGGEVNMVSIGTVATEIQSASIDNVLATGVTATLLAPDGVYFPYEDENNHKLVKDIGNVTRGMEITAQFAVKPAFTDVFIQKDTLPFQLQLSFKTRDQQKVTRIITEQRPVTFCSRIRTESLNTVVLGVHCAQLCARLTMEGRVQEAQRQLKAQQELLGQIRQQRPTQQEENIYGNWMHTMSTICEDISPQSGILSDQAAKVMYQMKRVSSATSSSRIPAPATLEKKEKK